jgi:hypothetical protein
MDRASGWTMKRRARQQEAIRNWRPWERSTGPRSTGGKLRSSRNADKGGRRKALRAELRHLRELIAELDDEQSNGL